MIGLGYSRRRAAYALGFSESTMRSAMQRNEAFVERVLRAEQRREILVLKNVRDATTKSWRAAKWYLERIAPDAYTPPTNAARIRRHYEFEARPLIDAIFDEIRDPKLRRTIIDKLRRIDEGNKNVNRWDHGLPPDFDRDAVSNRYHNATWLEQLADACDAADEPIVIDEENPWDGPHI
jgi:hypothetical protein